MKIKISELIDDALDWAVVTANGGSPTVETNAIGENIIRDGCVITCPSTIWSQGGPIIEREKVTLSPRFHAERSESGVDVYRQEGWLAYVAPSSFWVSPRAVGGPTPLIAAMRCYCASKLGDEVDVPDELC